MEEPEHYKANARNRLLAVDKSLLWIAEGVFHSTLCFFAFYFLWKDNVGHPGNNLGSVPSVMKFEVLYARQSMTEAIFLTLGRSRSYLF